MPVKKKSPFGKTIHIPLKKSHLTPKNSYKGYYLTVDNKKHAFRNKRTADKYARNLKALFKTKVSKKQRIPKFVRSKD